MKIDGLDWDDINIEHLAKRQISPIDAEDICFGKHLASIGKNRRYNLYGKTKAGRYIRLIIERLNDNKFRPITAFDMDSGEKRTFNNKIR